MLAYDSMGMSYKPHQFHFISFDAIVAKHPTNVFIQLMGRKVVGAWRYQANQPKPKTDCCGISYVRLTMYLSLFSLN